jgi:hypothetical protein
MKGGRTPVLSPSKYGTEIIGRLEGPTTAAIKPPNCNAKLKKSDQGRRALSSTALNRNAHT